MTKKKEVLVELCANGQLHGVQMLESGNLDSEGTVRKGEILLVRKSKVQNL